MTFAPKGLHEKMFCVDPDNKLTVAIPLDFTQLSSWASLTTHPSLSC
jgi:hypothetical protein